VTDLAKYSTTQVVERSLR